MKHISFIAVVVIPLLLTAPAWAGQCQVVGGVLMTNIGAIEGVTNLGPVSGDLQGSIAATRTGKFTNATGKIDYFGIADFKERTLVLRYRGKVCH